MQVKDLKKLLETAPDDAYLVVESSDHSYGVAQAYLTTAMQERPIKRWDSGGRGPFSEDFGQAEDSEIGKRVQVILVR